MSNRFIQYHDQNCLLEGFLSCKEASEKLPGLLLCHSWHGRDQFMLEKAKMFSEWGFSTFAIDLYGKGIEGHSKEESAQLMAPFMKDRLFLQKRLLLALNTFKAQPEVDANKIVAIGFCFGGLCALDIARSGTNIKGAISIHGLFTPPEIGEQKQIHAKILALHGYNDPLASHEQIPLFAKEMSDAQADWQLHIFGNTMHAFTDPHANDPAFGLKYSQVAEDRSWRLIKDFLGEVLK